MAGGEQDIVRVGGRRDLSIADEQKSAVLCLSDQELGSCGRRASLGIRVTVCQSSQKTAQTKVTS